ncbi:photosynthetic complex assembly protein PuhC [Fulvimarina sp. 2208YS6-2-32]|uniref:Photosynthetic complex assembly protein PuhC n=1 Tax=Fulvimarina uroteuthidis TaxID=3098149 RepID=A0ABU5HZU5_9HYPH|nr:photosynthetic complex assembly protein PuhC [Fulvimarina sp. 2208YS6-2-32]MDY8108491.1 photosynthetic complex assembly protein PuhC [Fulvimarina sp. 2208YS6-2-32]
MNGITDKLKSVDGKPLKFYPTPDRPIPLAILVGAGLLAFSAVAFGLASNRTGVGNFVTPVIETLASRDLILDDSDPAVAIIADARTGETLLSLPTEAGGFAVESLRNLQRYRTIRGARQEGAFVLALKADGRLVVEDPLTSRQVELRAFGAKNMEVFADLLPWKNAKS